MNADPIKLLPKLIKLPFACQGKKARQEMIVDRCTAGHQP
jgi:hypothetical protein